MSITDLKKNFENNIVVYLNLNSTIIIKCICLTKFYYMYACYYNVFNKYYNKDFIHIKCDKVKIITVYDIHKNIIHEPIQLYLFKDLIKINGILENLIEKNIYFFKTFIRAFITNNKLNNINYTISLRGYLNTILYNNIEIKLSIYGKTFDITDNRKLQDLKIDKLYMLIFYNDKYCIYFYKNNNIIIYTIFNDFIEITESNYIFTQYIYINKENLKILEIKEYHRCIKVYEEKRNNNNEITSIKRYDTKEESISNNKNFPFSKPLKKICIELINHYNENINNVIEIIKFLFKKEKEARYNLLLNYNLEMIESK